MRKGTFVLVCGMIFKAAERQALDIRNHNGNQIIEIKIKALTTTHNNATIYEYAA